MRKIIALGVIALFLGLSIVPSVGSQIIKTLQTNNVMNANGTHDTDEKTQPLFKDYYYVDIEAKGYYAYKLILLGTHKWMPSKYGFDGRIDIKYLVGSTVRLKSRYTGRIVYENTGSRRITVFGFLGHLDYYGLLDKGIELSGIGITTVRIWN